MAFFPLYPWLIRALAFVTRSDLVAGVLISLVAFAIALCCCIGWWRSISARRSRRTTVMLVAFCPMSMFFSAVYTESLFLALSIGSIYAARRETLDAGRRVRRASRRSRETAASRCCCRWRSSTCTVRATRPAPSRRRWAAETQTGLRRLLPRYRLAPNAAWLLLIPAGLGAYLAYLGIKYGAGARSVPVRELLVPPLDVPLDDGLATRPSRPGTVCVSSFHGPTPPDYVPGYAQSVIGAAIPGHLPASGSCILGSLR